jgi:hypothetical protein
MCIQHALSIQSWKKGWKKISADKHLDCCRDRLEDLTQESLFPISGIVLMLSILVMRKLIMMFNAKDLHPGPRLCSLSGRILSFKTGLGASLGFMEHDLSPLEELVFSTGATATAPKLSKNKHAQVEFIYAKAPM